MSNTDINYLVTLHKKGTVNTDGSVVVKSVEYRDFGDGFWVQLSGTDPSCYPEFVQDADLRWFSKDLTLMLNLEDPIDVIAVATTDEPIPEPEVTF